MGGGEKQNTTPRDPSALIFLSSFDSLFVSALQNFAFGQNQCCCIHGKYLIRAYEFAATKCCIECAWDMMSTDALNSLEEEQELCAGP